MRTPEFDRRLFLAAALTLIAATCWGASEEALTAIVGAKLIDGTGAEPVETSRS